MNIKIELLRENDLFSERELLHKVANGEEWAFSILFDRYWQQVYLHILRYVKKVSLSEDITQDIFFALWMQRSRLTEINEFQPYLASITRNRAISELRKKLNVLEHIPVEDIPELLFTPFQQSPDQVLERKQVRQIVLNAIHLLPPKRRKVFEMSRLEGHSHAEIADILQISKATVNEHIGEALIFLRSQLANVPEILTALLLITDCWMRRK